MEPLNLYVFIATFAAHYMQAHCKILIKTEDLIAKLRSGLYVARWEMYYRS